MGFEFFHHAKTNSFLLKVDMEVCLGGNVQRAMKILRKDEDELNKIATSLR